MTSGLRKFVLGFALGCTCAATAGIYLAAPGPPEPGPRLPSGYLIGRYGKPTVPSSGEPGPDLSVHGTVIWEPVGPAAVPPSNPTGADIPPRTAAAGPAPSHCDLNALSVQVDCAFDAYEAGEPWGRLRVSGVIRDGNHTRALPAREAQELDFRVAPRVAPKPPFPWLLEGRALVLGPDPGLRLGVAWYATGHRLGLTLDVDRTYRDISTTVPANPYLETGAYQAISRQSATTYGIGIAYRFSR